MSQPKHETKLKVINLGLKTFYEALEQQGNPVTHINWSPPASGNEEYLKILAKLRHLEK